jgi:hypothetical protein
MNVSLVNATYLDLFLTVEFFLKNGSSLRLDRPRQQALQGGGLGFESFGLQAQ